MPSAKVVALAIAAGRVEDAAQGLAAAATKRLRERLAPVLAPGEAVPDVGLLLDQFSRFLKQDRRELAERDRAHVRGRRAVGLIRAECDRRKAALRESLVDLRRQVRGLFGTRQGDHLLGLQGRIAREPLMLLRQARFAVDCLERAAAGIDDVRPRAGVASFDHAHFARRLQSDADRLEAAQAALVSTRVRGVAAIAAQRERYAAHRADLAQVTRLAETVFKLAGLPKMPMRARRKPKRKGGQGTGGGAAGSAVDGSSPERVR